jgi:hypothetical protein
MRKKLSGFEMIPDADPTLLEGISRFTLFPSSKLVSYLNSVETSHNNAKPRQYCTVVGS